MLGALGGSRLGAGPLRVVRGAGDPELPALAFDDPAPGPGGADLVLDRDAILAEYPILSPDVVAMLRPRRCGWLSAQQLGMWLLERAQQRGVRLLCGRVEAVETQDEEAKRKIMGKIIEYNEEDLDATWAVMNWFRARLR